MLIIRPEQMAAFREQALGDFEDQMAAYLSVKHPSTMQSMGWTALRGMVRQARAGGAGYGIASSRALGAWIELWLLFGEDLANAPDRGWVLGILKQTDLPDSVRVERIGERLFAHSGGRAVRVVHPVAEG